MGSIEGTGEDQAIMWRGFMLNRAVQHFLEDVRWGDMHYLLIDMPPGTADIQMGLARMLPRTEVVIVTTPALAAQQVAARAADMARKGYLRVAGVVENMSASVAPDGTRYAVFGSGGGERLAERARRAPAGIDPAGPGRGRRGRRRGAGHDRRAAHTGSPGLRRPGRTHCHRGHPARRWSPAPPGSFSKPPVCSPPCPSPAPRQPHRPDRKPTTRSPFRHEHRRDHNHTRHQPHR